MGYSGPGGTPTNPSACDGVVATRTLTVTAAGRLSLDCPVKRILKAKGRIYVWNGDCQSSGKMLSVATEGDTRLVTKSGAVYLETDKKYDNYFGIVVLTYETAGGVYVYLQKDDAVGGFDSLLPNNTDRFAVLKIHYQGKCYYKPVLLPDDTPIVASHAQAPCCACAPQFLGYGGETSSSSSNSY